VTAMRSETPRTEHLAVAAPVELRAGRSGSRTIGGYAAKFNRMSQNLGGFVEQVDPRFFNGSRGDGWPHVMARYNHDDAALLGTSDAGTLRLSLDTVGLLYDVDLPSSRGDVYELVGRGDVRQSSFAFIAIEDDWGVTDQGFPLRTLVSGRLIDVAPVNTPAYTDSTVGLRSLARHVNAPLEDVLALARRNELRKLLTRTDVPSPRIRRSARHALGRALEVSGRPGLRQWSSRLALIEVLNTAGKGSS
jgi:uncharacterized protein